MNKKLNKIKPAVDKRALLFLAGFMWICVGVMLLLLAYSWLSVSGSISSLVFAGAGIILALVVHHFGFLRIVDKNLRRILPMAGKKCMFSFITWKSYLTIAIMAVMGAMLRHSPVPKPYLAILYIGIGLALVLSSVRYMRVLITQFSNNSH